MAGRREDVTSTTDEIAALRRGLEHIVTQCVAQAKQCGIHDPALKGTWLTLADVTRQILKGPRASKLVEIDTLRLDWVLEHCEVAYRVSQDAPARASSRIGLSTREAIDTVKGIG